MSEVKILVVEDEGIISRDLKNTLRALGYAVPGIAATGEEAIQKAEEVDPDLVLMDIVLKGGMDGVSAAEKIKERFRIPVVYLTAYADQKTFHRAKLTDPYGYILKPFQEKELYTAIEMALYKHKMEEKLFESQQSLKELNSELERRVMERTAALEAANKELEAFSHSVSHDLRAPLRSMEGFSQALLDNYSAQLDDRGKDYLKRVSLGSQRMARLMDELLELSRLSRVELHRRQVPLSEMAHSIVTELQRKDPERQVKVSIQEGVTAQGDENLLQVVLQNLLDNAWKFTSKIPNAHIEFGFRKEEAPEKGIYFVRDNGAGFDMACVDRLFSAFQRLHGVKDFPGTGIGLATVRRIIHRHRGRVWAEGEVNRGATFYFTLGTGE